MPCDAVVRKYRVPAITRRQARHMAPYTIAPRRSVGFLERCAMAGETALSEIRRLIRRLLMRIVATPAPQPAAAVAGAHATRQLLRVADDFECLARRLCPDINGIDVLQPLAGLEIRNALSRIGDARFSRKMTLLADTVPRGPAQFRRIHNRPRHGIFHMPSARAVA